MTAPDPKVDMAAAVKHCARRALSADQMLALDDVALGNLVHLIEKWLRAEGPPPNCEEWEGIAERALEHLWHPAMGRTLDARTQSNP